MNKLAFFLLLALVAPASAWTILGDNILGRPYDYVTVRNPSNNDVIKYQSSTGRWVAGSASGSSVITIQTDGVAQGTTSVLNFSNGLSGSGGPTGNVSPTYGSAANTITQGNDARLPLAPSAGRRGDVVVYDAAGSAMTAVDAGTATDQAFMSLGANTPGAFRALIATDIDELLTFDQLSDVAITTAAANNIVVRNAGNTAWVNAVMSGDVTNSLGVMTIANNAVSNAKFRQGAGLSLVGVTGSSTANVADITGTANQIPIVNNAGTALAFVTVSGDLTNATGVFTIANSAVTTAKMANLAGLSLLGRSASTSGAMAAITGTANQIPVVDSTGTTLAFATVSGDLTNVTGAFTIANNAVSNAKFRQGVAKSFVGVTGGSTANVADITGTANQIPIINSTGNGLSFVSLSGDVTNTDGVMAIGNSKVTNAMLAGSITGGKILTLPDNITNVTSATDMTLTATGDEVILADLLKLLNDANDPTNESDVSYDSTDGVAQAKYKDVGRVSWGGKFFTVTSDSTGATASGDTTYSNVNAVSSFAFVSGKILQFEFSGSFGQTGSAATFTWKLLKGSTVIAQSSVNPGTSSAGTWVIRGSVTGRSTTTCFGAMTVQAGDVAFASRDHNTTDDSIGSSGLATVSSSPETLSLVVNNSTTGMSSVCKTGWFIAW